MDTFFRAAAGILVTVVLALTVGSQNKSFSSLLSMAVCVMVLLLCMSFLDPVVELMNDLETMGQLQGEYVKILLKVTLICIITEIASLLCADGGNTSLGQSLKFLSSCVILWLSIPVFRGLLELVRDILEGV